MVKELKKLRWKLSDVPIATQLHRLLFSYRNNPHTSTGETPTKLLFSYFPTTRLSFIQPSFACSMQKRQAPDVAPRREFSAGDLVWCFNQPHRGNNNRLKGVIRTRIGPLTYAVSYHGRIRHMYVEHLRFCKIATTPEFSSSSDQPSQQPVVLSSSSDSPLSQPSSNSSSSAPFPQPPSSSDGSSPPPVSPSSASPLSVPTTPASASSCSPSGSSVLPRVSLLAQLIPAFPQRQNPLEKSDHLGD